MKKVKRYWDNLPQYKKNALLRKYRFGGHLRDFPSEWLPEDFESVLIREMNGKGG